MRVRVYICVFTVDIIIIIHFVLMWKKCISISHDRSGRHIDIYLGKFKLQIEQHVKLWRKCCLGQSYSAMGLIHPGDFDYKGVWNTISPLHYSR